MSYDVLADLVEETTTTTGTGNLTLGGASGVGLRTFNAAVGLNARVPYAIGQDDQSEWEVGVGYLSASTTFVRERVISSSNANAAVSFSAGTKKIRIAAISEWLNEELGRALAAGTGM
jgi:hypothetical protein